MKDNPALIEQKHADFIFENPNPSQIQVDDFLAYIGKLCGADFYPIVKDAICKYHDRR